MADFNVLTGFKGFFDDFDKAIYGVSGLLLVESRTVGRGLNNVLVVVRIASREELR